LGQRPQVSKGTPSTSSGFKMSVFAFLRKLREASEIGDDLTIHGLSHTCTTMMREAGFDNDTIADMLGQETAGMAEWYARDAVLDRKLASVVEDGGIEALGQHDAEVHLVFDRDVRASPQIEVFSEQLQRASNTGDRTAMRCG
jgi:Phage integrase family